MNTTVKAPRTDAASALPTREAILAGLPKIAAEIAEGAVERELGRAHPFEIFQRLRSTGLTWLRVPKSLGGPGGSLADSIEVICTLAAADSNVAHALRTHFGFLKSIAIDPQSETSRRHAAAALEGKLFGGAYMEIGTPRPNTIRTTLVRKGDRYILSGRKYYATGTIYADYAFFIAVGEDGRPVSVLVPVDRKGVRILDDWDGIGQTMTGSGGVDLDDVEVFPDEVAPRQADDPFRRRHSATRAQLHLAACVGGIARAVLADAVSYTVVHARSAKHSASETARGDAFVQQTVGDIAAASHVIDAAIADTARLLDASAEAIVAGAPDIDDRLMRSALGNAKTHIIVGRLALQAAERLFDTGGGSATSRKFAHDRHWRNIRTILNHNPLALKARVVGDYHLNGTRTDFDEGRVF
ncbi:MAG: acyl-CoA dehydrogenase [Bauldia sp.]|nr:acyl-CoA dehydrogenase [Bauldia sp.]